jgi:hypothetical protein
MPIVMGVCFVLRHVGSANHARFRLARVTWLEIQQIHGEHDELRGIVLALC